LVEARLMAKRVVRKKVVPKKDTRYQRKSPAQPGRGTKREEAKVVVVENPKRQALDDSEAPVTVGQGVARNNFAARRRALAIMQWRENINTSKCLNSLGDIDDTLRKEWRSLSAEQISALRLRADLLLRKLAKTLPDAREPLDLNAGASGLVFRLRLMPMPAPLDADVVEGELVEDGQ